MTAEKPPFAGAPFTWLVLQLLAIALAAARVNLWAKFPAAGETMALDELIVVQFIASSLLFPFMCRDIRSTVAMIVASWPMIALGSYLSFNTIATGGMVALNLAVWLFALQVWGKVASSFRRRDLAASALGRFREDAAATREDDSTSVLRYHPFESELILVAFFSSLNLAGPVLAYLSTETNNSFSAGFLAIPLLAAVRISHFPTLFLFVPSLGALAMGLCALGISRAKISTSVMH